MHRRHYDQIVQSRDSSIELTNTDWTDTLVPTTEQVCNEVSGNNSESIINTTTGQKLEEPSRE